MTAAYMHVSCHVHRAVGWSPGDPDPCNNRRDGSGHPCTLYRAQIRSIEQHTITCPRLRRSGYNNAAQPLTIICRGLNLFMQ